MPAKDRNRTVATDRDEITLKNTECNKKRRIRHNVGVGAVVP